MTTTMTAPAHRRTSIEGFPQTAAGAEIHGEIVSWEWSNNGERFSIADIRDALTAAGLDPKLARDMLPRNAFARACKVLAEKRIIRKVTEDNAALRFQFTAEELATSGDRFDYALETILTLDKATGDITCDHAELADKARTAVDAEMGRRKPGDVSDIVGRLFNDKRKADLDLIPLRKQGGVYFVRRERLDFVDQVEDFLGRLNATITRLPIQAGSAAGDRAIKVAVADKIQGLLAELTQTVEEFGADTGERAINTAAERIKLAQFKVESYAEYLGSERGRMEAAVDAARGRLRAKVAEVMRLKADAEAAASLPLGG